MNLFETLQTMVDGRTISISVETVTPEEAKTWLTETNKKNRHMNKNHVGALSRNMQNGTWRFNGDTICFDENGTLIDGQHRLSAIMTSGISIPMIVIRGLDPETIKTKDMEVKPRNLGDLLQMDGVQCARQRAAIVTRYMVLSRGNTILSVKAGSPTGLMMKSVGTIEEKYNTYYNHQILFDDCSNYGRLLSERVQILTCSEIGAFYAFLYLDKHHSDDEIRGFFDRLFFNGGEINVIRLLQEKLINDLRAPVKMSGAYKQNIVAKAWNYYIKQKDVKILSFNNKTEGQIEFI